MVGGLSLGPDKISEEIPMYLITNECPTETIIVGENIFMCIHVYIRACTIRRI